MVGEYVGLAIAWLIVILSNQEDLGSEKRRTRLKAVGIILLSTLATGYSAWVIWQLNDRRPIERAQSEAVGHFLQEASGGSRFRSHVLLVDDEGPAILRMEADGDGKLTYIGSYGIFEGTRQVGKELENGVEGVDDLEGLAISADRRFVYLTTSHSNNKKGVEQNPRSFVLRGCFRDGRFVLLDRALLRDALKRKIFNRGVAEPLYVLTRDDSGLASGPRPIVMEVEGLAADPKGYLYFGLRAPLSTKKNNALIARIAASALFPKTPPDCRNQQVQTTTVAAEAIHLVEMPLRKGRESYGIVSMEYDDDRDELVFVGNSPQSSAALKPIVCRWNPERRPSSRLCAFLPETKEPYWGKQEALVLGPSADKATIFIDGDKGLGGWVTYDRDDLGL